MIMLCTQYVSIQGSGISGITLAFLPPKRDEYGLSPPKSVVKAQVHPESRASTSSQKPCRNQQPKPCRQPAARTRNPARPGQGWYEPGSQARVLTPIAFQALIVTIRLISAPTSCGLNCAATAW